MGCFIKFSSSKVGINLHARFRRYYDIAGIRGIFAIAGYRLIRWPSEIKVHTKSIRQPVNIRLRTTDVYAYREVLLGGEYSFDLPFTPKTIVDVGANIGMASLYFAHRYPEAKIVAVEAEVSNYAVLARNVKDYPAIKPVHAALWNRDGEIGLSQASTRAVAHWAFTTREGEGVPVRAITMRTLLAETELHSVDLLKVDIEGAEKEVFEGCNWIDKIGCLMVELHDRLRPGCSEAVNSATKGFYRVQHGFTTLYLRENAGTKTTAAGV